MPLVCVSEVEQLTALSARAHNPCSPPDGRCILFQSDHEGSPQIYRLDLEENIRRLYGVKDTFRVTAAPLPHTHPAVSRRGCVAVQREENGLPRVVLTDLSGGEMRLLPGGEWGDRTPAFSPDGGRVAVSSPWQGREQIWIIRLSDGERRRITDGEHLCKHPQFSPDGKELVYVREGRGGWQIVLRSLEREEGRIVETGIRLPQHPAVSPDGRTIAVQGIGEATTEIFLVDRETGRVRSRTQLHRGVHKPVFSPVVRATGSSLLFSARRGEGWEIVRWAL